jgi:hypothetical protein
MSTSDSNLDFLEFSDKDENGYSNPTLKFTYNDDGTATLEHPRCKNRKIIFDQSVVNNYLKKIETKQNQYTFDRLGKVWLINPVPTPNTYPASNIISFVSGDMIDDGKKITCINPIHLTPEPQ